MSLVVVPELESRMLPKPLRGWVSDVSVRMGVPLEAVAIPCIVGISSILGRRCLIFPKAEDKGWAEAPNLWGMLIDRPGSLKTPASEQALYPLQNRENRSYLEYKKAQSKLRRELAEVEGSGAANDGGDGNRNEKLIKMEMDDMSRRRWIVNDTSVFRLASILSESEDGVLIYRDELNSWITATAKSNTADRGFYLEGWSGKSGHTLDRHRHDIHVEQLNFAVYGTSQPGVMAKYVKTMLRNGGENDGLITRFGLLVYPDTRSKLGKDRKPNKEAKAEYAAVFDKVASVEHGLELHFTEAAQDVFDRWHRSLHEKMEMSDSEAFANHLSKYRKHIPALCAIFHVVEESDYANKKVSKATAMRAIEWACYLETHARKFYRATEDGDGVQYLIDKMKGGDVYDGMKYRDFQRKVAGKFRESDRLKKCLLTLERGKAIEVAKCEEGYKCIWIDHKKLKEIRLS